MLLSKDNCMIRVLQTKGDRSLVIDCIKRTMPKWVATEDLAAYTECSESDLYDRTGINQNRELAEHIQTIANKGKPTDVEIKGIRSTRKREQERTHIDFVKEGAICG